MTTTYYDNPGPGRYFCSLCFKWFGVDEFELPHTDPRTDLDCCVTCCPVCNNGPADEGEDE